MIAVVLFPKQQIRLILGISEFLRHQFNLVVEILSEFVLRDAAKCVELRVHAVFDDCAERLGSDGGTS